MEEGLDGEDNGGKEMIDFIDRSVRLVEMLAESIPDDSVEDILGDHYGLYMSIKDRKLAKFLLGMMYSEPDSASYILMVMGYLAKHQDLPLQDFPKDFPAGGRR